MLPVALVCLALLVLTTIIHYEALRGLAVWLPDSRIRPRARPRAGGGAAARRPLVGGGRQRQRRRRDRRVATPRHLRRPTLPGAAEVTRTFSTNTHAEQPARVENV